MVMTGMAVASRTVLVLVSAAVVRLHSRAVRMRGGTPSLNGAQLLNAAFARSDPSRPRVQRNFFE